MFTPPNHLILLCQVTYYKRFIAIDSLLVTITRQTLKGIQLFTDDNLLYILNDDQQILLFPKIKIIG